MIIESFVRASHTNVTKGLANPTGACMLLESAMYARIGMWYMIPAEVICNNVQQELLTFPGSTPRFSASATLKGIHTKTSLR